MPPYTGTSVHDYVVITPSEQASSFKLDPFLVLVAMSVGLIITTILLSFLCCFFGQLKVTCELCCLSGGFIRVNGKAAPDADGQVPPGDGEPIKEGGAPEDGETAIAGAAKSNKTAAESKSSKASKSAKSAAKSTKAPKAGGKTVKQSVKAGKAKNSKKK